jgi:hypothetical protein
MSPAAIAVLVHELGVAWFFDALDSVGLFPPPTIDTVFAGVKFAYVARLTSTTQFPDGFATIVH